MKFEFDHKTGTMMPKKDEQIYFAKSMSGGLRVDDHKNNIKYIIERTGKLTILQGNRALGDKFLHVYDQRDAHIIAERVMRMFGRDHKYTNYRLFLKGVFEAYIKKFDEFAGQ